MTETQFTDLTLVAGFFRSDRSSAATVVVRFSRSCSDGVRGGDVVFLTASWLDLHLSAGDAF